MPVIPEEEKDEEPKPRVPLQDKALEAKFQKMNHAMEEQMLIDLDNKKRELYDK